MFGLLKRKPVQPNASDAARVMAQAGVEQRRAKVRAVCDDMRARMGLEPARWPE